MKRKIVFFVFSLLLMFGATTISASESDALTVNESNGQVEEDTPTVDDSNATDTTVDEAVTNGEGQQSEEVEQQATTDEEAVEVQQMKPSALVNAKADFEDAFNNATDGEVLELSAGLINELGTSTTGVNLTTVAGDTRNIIIDGKGQTIDFSSNTSVFTLFNMALNGSGTVTFKNLNIANAQGTGKYFMFSGIGNATLDNMVISDGKMNPIVNGLSGTFTVENSTIKNNVGTAISDTDSKGAHNIIIRNTYFYNNNSGFNGGALQVSQNAIADVESCTFEDNSTAGGYMGGAIATQTEKGNINLTVKKSYFLNNSSFNNVGGAIGIYHLVSGKVTVEDCIFESNKANGADKIKLSDGGAIAIKNNGTAYSGELVVSGTSFLNNYASDNGGAMLIEASNGGNTKATLFNNTFVGNQSSNNGAWYKSWFIGSGVGGAIQTYDSPLTEISHNTFYHNDSLNSGTGGAIGMGGQGSATVAPTVANNIFVDNNSYKAASISSNVDTSGVKANVNNNGNVGYDNGKKFIPDDATRNALVKVENIFTDIDSSGNAIPATVPGTIGASAKNSVRTAYTPSPVIDEMLRTNDPRTTTGVLTDVRGYPRETLSSANPYYPNAGAVEIYWTKFDPGSGAWSSRLDVEAENGIESLAYPGVFYKVNNPPTFDSNGDPVYEENLTFTRNTLVGPAGEGFVGWEDTETHEVKDVNEKYYARKQTYVAQWRLGDLHVDFDLKGGTPQAGHTADFATQTVSSGGLATEPASIPEKPGFVFDGWYTDDSSYTTKWNFASDTVTADVTLYAKWSPVTTVVVDFDMNGHGTQVPSQTINAGTVATKPTDPSEVGYVFKGWYTDAACTVAYNFADPVNASMTLYAKWEEEVISKPSKPVTPPVVKPSTPATGDNTNILLWVALLGISSVVFLRKYRLEK